MTTQSDIDCVFRYDAINDRYELVRKSDGFVVQLDKRFNRRWDWFAGVAHPVPAHVE